MNKDNAIYLMGILLIIFLAYTVFSKKNNIRQLKANGIRTEGVITPYGSDFIVKYQVNSRSYKARKSNPFANLQEGEKYKVAYDKDEPDNVIVLFYEPILDEDFLESKTTSVSQTSSGNVLFYFDIDGNEIQRYNELKPDYDIDESKTYKVKYLKDNPKVAYIIY